jgi:Protein of unknown function (DUF2628)
VSPAGADGAGQVEEFNCLVTFTVHEPSQPAADRIDRGADLRFVKDGFSWITALFPPFGLAASQLWLPLLAYVVFVGVGAVGLTVLGVSENWISLALLALNIFMGFEHSTLQRWTLDNAGWNMLGTVTGKTLDECERRFFESWLPGQPMVAALDQRSGPPSGGWRSPWTGLAGKS